MQHETPRYLIERESGSWEVVIGLEVHAQIISKSKLFSGAETSFAAPPNYKVSPVDAAMPGMLPVLNEFCVEQAIKTGLGLNAHINKISRFDRKNYFYADLPAGYQISQFYTPIVGEGYLDIDLNNDVTQRIRIERVHLEQDAGKSLHDLSPTKSFIDLNRAGTGLMEIVTKPDIRSPEEAMTFVKKLRLLLRYLGTSDGNMEEGSLRADVNISVRRMGEPLGTRAEIKNVNSIRFIGEAIQYEIDRQIELIEAGSEVIQETRLYDANKRETRSMRNKENAHDYRYFPDPDLLPVIIEEEFLDHIRASLPELPDVKKKRFMNQYGLSSYDATLLVGDVETPTYYESVLCHTKNWNSENPNQEIAKLSANWLLGELFAALNRDNLSLAQSKVPAAHLAGLINLLIEGTISGRIAKEIFTDMWETQKHPADIVKEKGLVQVSDIGAIEKIIDQVLKDNPQVVQDYHSGKDKLFGFFVGQVMKAMAGKGNPQMINNILKDKLKK